MCAKRAPALEVRLLGAPDLRRAGEPVPFPPSRKVRALLAYLVATRLVSDGDRVVFRPCGAIVDLAVVREARARTGVEAVARRLEAAST